MGHRLLGSEATCGVRMENGTDEVLGCDVGRESQITALPQAAVGPRRPQKPILLPSMSWKTRIYICA